MFTDSWFERCGVFTPVKIRILDCDAA